MANKVQIRRSISSGQVPSAGQLTSVGELFVNTADQKFWVSKGDGTMWEVGAVGAGSGLTYPQILSITSLRI